MSGRAAEGRMRDAGNKVVGVRSAKRGRGCLVAVGVLVVVLVLLGVFRQEAGRFAAGVALRYLGRALNGRIEYGALRGNVFTHPKFEDVLVVFGSDSVRAEELAFSYDLFGLLRGTVPLSEVEIRNPVVFLSLKAAEKLPEQASGPVSYPKLLLKTLRITGGRLYLAGRERADSLSLVLSVRSRPQALEAQLMNASGRLIEEKVSIAALDAACRMTPDSLVLEQLTLRTLRSRMEGNLRLSFDGAGADAVLESLVIDLGEFFDFPGRFIARGKAGVRGETRSGEVDYAAEELVVGRIRLPVLRGRLNLEEPLVTFTATGADPGLGDIRLDAEANVRELTYDARLAVTGLRVQHLEPRLPDLDVDVSATVRGRGSGSVSGRAELRVPELGVERMLVLGRYDAGRVVLERLETQGPAGRMLLAADVSFAGKRFRVLSSSCTMESLDFGVVSAFVGTPTAGRLSGTMSARGSLDSIELSGGLRAWGLQFGGVTVDQGLADVDMVVGRALHGRFVAGVENIRGIGIEPEAAQLVIQDADFDFRIDRPEDRLLAGGRITLERRGFSCDVDRFEFAVRDETLALDEPFAFDWSPDSMSVRGVRYSLADGRLELDLSQKGRAWPAVKARGTNLNLRKLQKLFRLEQEMWGTFSFEISGQESLAAQVSAEDVEIPSIGMMVKDAAAAFALSRSELRVDRLWFVHAVETTSVTGRLGYGTDDGFRLEEIEVAAEIADPGDWLLWFLSPTLELRGGQIYGQVNWRGQIDKPDVHGRLRVVNGTLLFPAINVRLERTNAELTASGGRISLEKLAGASGGGTVTASGFVELGNGWQVDSLRYRIRPDGAAVSPLPEVYAVVGGDVSIAWGTGRSLSVEGTVDVEEALLAFGFGGGGQNAVPAGGDGNGEPAPVVFDIRVKGERGIWLRNPLVDIELSADLAIRKTLTEETYSGVLSSRQGNIYYLDRTLKVTRGVIAFDNISILNPRLDIVAELPVRAGLRDNGDAPDKVVLTLGGTLHKPEFSFAAEPPIWDESQIVTYLSLNITAEDLAALENREVAARYLSERLLGYFQTQASKRVRKLVGLDELRFESAFVGGEGYKVTVGKYVGRSLYFTYTQNFTGVMQPAFTVEYYLNRSNEIVGARSEDGRYSVRYRLRLRY